MRNSSLTIVLALGAALGRAAPAAAVDVVVPSPVIPGPSISPGELQIQRNIQSRQNFHLEQRIHREIDRLTIQQPMPQPRVDRTTPSCVQDVNGRKDLRDCR